MSDEILVAQQRFRIKQAFKIALASVLSIFIAVWLDMPLAFFAPIGSFVIMTVFHDQTVSKGIERVLGPFVMVLVVMISLNLAQNLLLYLILAVLMLLIGTYLFFQERYPYASLMGAIIGSACVAVAITSPSEGISLGLHFVEVTIIGVVVAWFVTMLIWPVQRDKDLYPSLAAVIGDLVLILTDKKVGVDAGRFAYLRQLLNYTRYQFTSRVNYNNHYHFIIALKQVYIKLIAYRQTLSQLKQTSLYKDFIDELGPLANNHNELIACHLLKVKEACLSHQLVDFNLEVIKEQIENFEQLLTKWREEERFSGCCLYIM